MTRSGINAWLMLLCSAQVNGDIVFDNTVGKRVTADRLSGNINIPAARGDIRGANLFHSFNLFNIDTGEQAVFQGPNNIDHIISRVTGNSSSRIDGPLISTIGGADFWFINPHGVVFGPNAALDVKGSFHVSTADYLRLGRGGVFSATQPEQSHFISAPPEAFGFLGDHPAPINFEASQMEVPIRHIFSVVGGDINITGGSQLTAPVGRFNLVSVASAGDVARRDSSLAVESIPRFGMITMTESIIGDIGISATQDLTGGGGVLIRGGRFVLEDVSLVQASTPLGPDSKGIDIEVTDDLVIRTASSIFADTAGPGRAGDIAITAGRLQIFEGAGITALTQSDLGGDGGNITIKAGELVLEGAEGIGSRISTETGGNGDAGAIMINTGVLQLRGGSEIVAEAKESASGLGGNVDIHAADIELQGKSRVSSQSTSAESNAGRSGQISIHASDKLELLDDSSVSVETQRADAGNIDIRAGNLVKLRDGSAITTSVAGGEGSGGDINLGSTFVVLDGGSRIIAQAKEGSGGNINISAEFLFQSPNSFIDASSEFGQSGTVTINSPDTNILGGITPLPETFFDAAALMKQHCAARAAGGRSSLVLRGGRIGVEPGVAPLFASYMESKSDGERRLEGIDSESAKERNSASIPDRFEGLSWGCESNYSAFRE